MTNRRTIKQVVESAYAWANGDAEEGEWVALEDVATGKTGDTFLDFMLEELDVPAEEEAVRAAVGGGTDDVMVENSPEHWAEAITRMERVVQEVQRVYDELRRHAPPGVLELFCVCGQAMIVGPHALEESEGVSHHVDGEAIDHDMDADHVAVSDAEDEDPNVHAEHCCLHGCKYGDLDCPVATGIQRQVHPCESCGTRPDSKEGE